MAENGTASLPVSLRPLTDGANDDVDNLVAKIRLINQQRDGFRNVTEEQLQLEMNEGKDETLEDSESEEDDDEESKKGTVEALFQKRAQMHRELQENALWALDSFSLAASSILKQSFQTASPAMRDAIKEGSFSYVRRQPQPTANPEKERQKNQLWSGSFMTNNTESADALLAAATRLEGLVKAETEYWGQLLSLTSNGWPVYKPGPQAPMHVRFVASEASPYFKSQGVARLVPDKDGAIKLSSRVGSEPRTLRLRLSRRGEIVSSSVTASLLSLADLGSSLEDKVRREQSSLFEEELFQEMVMESRVLQPIGVKLRDKVLHLPITSAGVSGDEYLLDLIPIDEAADMVVTTGSAEDKEFLDAQSVLLRLLLCHVYHLRLQRRSRIPPPLSDTPRKEPPSSIIRSFVALNQHRAVCMPLSNYLTDLHEVLERAGLPFSCDAIKVPGLHELLENTVKDTSKLVEKVSLLHGLLEQSSKPQQTTAVLRLVTKSSDGTSAEHKVTVHAYTNLSPPLYGSEFAVELPRAIATLLYGPESHDKKVTFANLQELTAFLNQLLSLHVVRQVLLPTVQGWAATADMPIISKIVADKDGKQQHKVSVGIKVDQKQIELRRRWFGGRTDQDREVWSSSTSSSAASSSNGRTLPGIFEAWANDS